MVNLEGVSILGGVYGLNVPDTIRETDTQLKMLLAKHCRGPYDYSGVKIGLALYLQGESQIPFVGEGIKMAPFRNSLICASIYITKADWKTSLASYRQFLWRNIQKAVWGCVEFLKTKKRITIDEERLKVDLSRVGAELLGREKGNGIVVDEKSDVTMSFNQEYDGEKIPIVIQYLIDGQGCGADHDKRVKIEDIIGEFLENADLGYCDGGDIGSGTMNVFCFVKLGQDAGKKIIEVLRNNSMLEGAIIAETVEGEERVIWPPDFKGEFQLICR